MMAEYSILRFSPAPEIIEAANVAVVFWEPRPRILFEPHFPRLACLAPDADMAMLRFYLEDLRSRLDLDARSLLASSQFQLSERRQITAPLSRHTEKLIIQKYLLRVSPTKTPRTHSTDEYITSKLQTFLTRRIGLPAQDIMKRAAPHDFLTPAVTQKHFQENSLHVARVVSGKEVVLVADAISRGSTPIDRIETRAMKRGSAFYRLGKAQADIERLEGRRLVRVVVLFGEGDKRTAGRLEYVEDSLRREAEYLEEASHPDVEFNKVARASAGLLF